MNNNKVANDTYIIDPLIFGIKRFTAVYLLTGDTHTLFDCGSTNSAPLILKSIESLGFNPKDITRIILSHLHFDHASGAGELLKYLPSAKVYVHPAGYNHLIDPSRLIKSSRKVFGDKLDEWYGGYGAVDKEKIVQVDNGDIIDLGGDRKLKVFATSGHAKHGICIYDPHIDGLFTGDETGVFLPPGPSLIPTTPPPDFDPDHNIETNKQLQSIKPKMLLFAHYGTTTEVDQALEDSMYMLASWKKIAGECLDKGLGFDGIVDALRVNTKEILGSNTYAKDALPWILDYHIPMCAGGYFHYFTKKKGV